MSKYLLFLIFLFASCNEEQMITTQIDVKESECYQFIQLSSSYDLEIVQLETNTNCLIGEIDKVIRHDSLIYILDSKLSKAVFIFNCNGKLVRKISVMGKGIGECLYLSDFDIYDDNIYLISGFDRKLLKFNLEGNFIKEYKSDKYLGAQLHFLHNYNFFTTTSNSLLSVDFWELNPNKKELKYNKRVFNNDYSFMNHKNCNISSYSGKTYICNTYQDIIFEIIGTGLYSRYTFNFESPFPIVQATNLEKFNELNENKQFTLMIDFAMSEKYMFLVLLRNGRLVSHFHDRELNKGYTGEAIYYENVQLCLLKGEMDNGLIFETPAHILHKYKELNVTILENLTNIEPTDNPILFFLTEKEVKASTNNAIKP
jgi:hypothetical protein